MKTFKEKIINKIKEIRAKTHLLKPARLKGIVHKLKIKRSK